MSEAEVVEYLTSRGLDRPEAELAAKDADLWINDPYMRYAIEDEEAVKQWRAAAEYLGDLVTLGVNSPIYAPWFNEAIIQAPRRRTRPGLDCPGASEREAEASARGGVDKYQPTWPGSFDAPAFRASCALYVTIKVIERGAGVVPRSVDEVGEDNFMFFEGDLLCQECAIAPSVL